jgi:flavodoxin I
MNVQVIYFSRKGSTKKIADAISAEVGVDAVNVKSAILNKNEFVFLGSGCYGGKPGKNMINFILENDFSEMKIALFGTSGGGYGKETDVMETMLKEKGVLVKDKFYCKGKFFLFNKNKTNEQDITAAKQFAHKLCE